MDKAFSWTYLTGSEVENWPVTETFSTIDEAIAAGREAAISDGEECFFVGKLIYCVPSPPDEEHILDNAREELYDRGGEAADNWNLKDAATKDLRNRLEILWYEWIDRWNMRDALYEIIEVSEHSTEVEVD